MCLWPKTSFGSNRWFSKASWGRYALHAAWGWGCSCGIKLSRGWGTRGRTWGRNSKVPEQETSDPEDDEEEEETVSQAEEPTQWEGEQTHYMSRVGKLLHMMCWSRQEIYNAVRNCQGTWKQGQRISMSRPWRGSWINAWPKEIEDWS